MQRVKTPPRRLKGCVADADADCEPDRRRFEDVARPAHQPNIDKCNACGKLFPRVGIRLCKHCAVVEEHRFELVREFLQEHEGAVVGEISQETGVSASDVQYFMERGRLIALENVCTCGGIGERCRFCRTKLAGGLRDLQKAMQGEQQLRRAAGGEVAHERTTYVRRIRRLGEG
jgi:hypothetical protein